MPWLTPSVFKQVPGEALICLPRLADRGQPLRFRHIVHAYDDRELPANTAVQAITFRTMRDAIAYAGPELPVTAVAVTYPDDAHLVPDGIERAPPLCRHAADVADFKIRRPLPLLFDILGNGLVDASGASAPGGGDYIVHTNSDIHLQPYFYKVLAELIGQGWDAITVNRRTVGADPEQRDFSTLFMADAGADHPGFDCFVFPAHWFAGFAQSRSCCGASYVMRGLLYNLVARASRMLMLSNAHMTFHLGDDRKWEAAAYGEYEDFNLAEARNVLRAYAGDSEAFSRLHPFVLAHEEDPFKQTVRQLAGAASA
jgi:hypothetical protein